MTAQLLVEKCPRVGRAVHTVLEKGFFRPRTRGGGSVHPEEAAWWRAPRGVGGWGPWVRGPMDMCSSRSAAPWAPRSQGTHAPGAGDRDSPGLSLPFPVSLGSLHSNPSVCVSECEYECVIVCPRALDTDPGQGPQGLAHVKHTLRCQRGLRPQPQPRLAPPPRGRRRKTSRSGGLEGPASCWGAWGLAGRNLLATGHLRLATAPTRQGGGRAASQGGTAVPVLGSRTARLGAPRDPLLLALSFGETPTVPGVPVSTAPGSQEGEWTRGPRAPWASPLACRRHLPSPSGCLSVPGPLWVRTPVMWDQASF